MPPSRRFPDIGAVFILFILPLILFGSVTLGPKTVLPLDNLYQWQPYRDFARQLGVPQPPHNALISDLVLENLAWKQFANESIRSGELPLWNPNLFAGTPFLAAGQHSMLYPFSILFFVFPLTRAYGLFIVSQLWLAGTFMYLLVRVLRQGRFPALISGITYQLSAFFVVSVVHPMIIAAAVWLPLLLAIVEMVIRVQEDRDAVRKMPVGFLAIGAVAFGLLILAGHPEILIYSCIVIAYFTAVRLFILWRQLGQWRPVLRGMTWLAVMVVLGLGLGLIQLVPMYELVTTSHREGLVSYADVVGWAFPRDQLITFLVPDYFGNPADHSYWDVRSWQWAPIGDSSWGSKNYVEAGSYVGILPLVLAAVALAAAAFRKTNGRFSSDRRSILIFAGLAYGSLLFVFGTPLYAILYYGLPGIKQLHSPFRWIFPYTLGVAVLAGFGAQQLFDLRSELGRQIIADKPSPLTVFRKSFSWLTWGTLAGGFVLLGVLLVALIFPRPFIATADRFVASSPEASRAFGDGQTFLSYQWSNFLTLGLMLITGGAILHLVGDPVKLSFPFLPSSRWTHLHLSLWQPMTMIVLVIDLFLFGWGFNTAAESEWLEFVPPAIEFLKERQGGQPWRLTVFQVEGSNQTLNANIPWLHDLQDIRGYDSIIPQQYVDFIQVLEGQGELFFNRIAPIYGVMNLSSPLLDLLNVRYVVTEGVISNPDYDLAYDGEVRIFENVNVMPRAFALPQAQAVSEPELNDYLRIFDPRQVVLLPESSESVATGGDWPLEPANIVSYNSNRVVVDVEMPGSGWLVLTDSFFPGWQAFRSDPGTTGGDSVELEIVRADGVFRAVQLDPGEHRVVFLYKPMSFKLGLYGSLVAMVALLLSVGYWIWVRSGNGRAVGHLQPAVEDDLA